MSPKRFERRKPYRERRKLYIIATEGMKTEQIYFNVFNGDEFRKNVHIRILATRRGESSPKAVLDRLRRYIRDVDIGNDDELWVVVDVDKWGANAIDEICRECLRINGNVAVSNPCFELWLVLHQENPRTPLMARDCERELERFLGRYDKSEYDVYRLIPHIQHAIRHAQRLDHDPNEPWPRSVGSRVYRLVQRLLE